jgi:16S rRNA (adenine1518-N6/adenine1519-N6)-dimethyltransferase
LPKSLVYHRCKRSPEQLIRAKKSLGQNFLTDHRVAQRIVDAANPLRTDIVIEIGPGTGALTRLLVERSGVVEAIELDERLAVALRRSVTATSLEIRVADAMTIDWPDLISSARNKLEAPDRDKSRIRFIANLPYYISTPILENLLSLRRSVFDMTLMLQKEVADRITEGPGGKEYGALSVIVQYQCVASKLFDVPPSAFTPAPKVHSAVVHLTVREQPPVDVRDEAQFFSLVRAAFAQRRKTILNNLKAAAAVSKFVRPLEEALEAASVSSQRRAETLSVAEFAALTNALFIVNE